MTGNYWHSITRRRLGRRRLLATTGAGAAGAALLAACGGGESKKAGGDTSGLLFEPVDEVKNVKRGGQLVTAGRRLTSLDPIGSSAIGIVDDLYSKLWARKAGYLAPSKGDMIGDTFESWEVSPDKLQITAKVSTKAHFVPTAPLNGRVVTAQDVAYTWERYKKIGALRSELVNEVDPAAPIISMTALDDRTVVIKVKEPDATIFSVLGQERAGVFYVLPKEAEDIDIRNKSIGAGPWMIKDWAPGIGALTSRNPGYGQDYRGTDLPYADEWNYPELQESALALAQMKAGGITEWSTYIPYEELLPMKRGNPDLLMYVWDLETTSMRFVMGNLPESPFRDERVRQAASFAYDKDLAIDTLGATAAFEAAGVPVEKVYDSAMAPNQPGVWWLDPKSKEFGPNGQYFRYDMAEAKKLLAAAGYKDYLKTTMTATFGYNPGILKKMEVIMALFGGGSEGVIRYDIKQLDYSTEWSPVVRFGKGKHNGVALIQDVDTPDAALYLYSRYNSKGGVYQGGDATTDELTAKAKREFDDDKRKELVYEIQRYEGKAMHFPFSHGGASTFVLTWPALRNFNVWQGGYNPNITYWLDQTKAPFNKA
jgi:ABC-type transport system substrate-binding protein